MGYARPQCRLAGRTKPLPRPERSYAEHPCRLANHTHARRRAEPPWPLGRHEPTRRRTGAGRRAAAALFALDAIEGDEALRQKLQDSIASFAKRSAARRCIERGVRQWCAADAELRPGDENPGLVSHMTCSGEKKIDLVHTLQM